MKKFKTLLSILTLAFVVASVGCSKSDDGGGDSGPTSVDKTALTAKITTAQTLYDGATQGTGTGQYPAAAMTAFNNAITAAKNVENNAQATQPQVDAAIAALTQAITTFEASAIGGTGKPALIAAITAANKTKNESFIGFSEGEFHKEDKDIFIAAITVAQSVYDSAAATEQEVANAVTTLTAARTTFLATVNSKDYDPFLSVHLKMDGNVTDDSYYKHAAELLSRGTLPTLTTDRFGVANKAYMFTSGCIAVPNTTYLRKEEVTITFWVKANTEVTPPAGEQAMVSLNWWEGFLIKRINNWNRDSFYVQSNNMPANYYIGAWNQNFDPPKWEHIAIVIAKTYCHAYINGVKDDNDTGFESKALTITDVEPLCVGALSANNDIYPFLGSLDDFRYYSKPLTATEILAIYNAEKP